MSNSLQTRRATSLASSLLCLLACSSILARAPDPSTSISIKSVDDHYELTVPVGHVTMLLPKGSFEVQRTNSGGAADSPRYFMLKDNTTGAIVSGWFESSRGVDDAGETLKKSWPSESAALSKEGLVPANVENKAIDAWQAITYRLPIKDEVSSHIRASQVIKDTWIDLHLSVTRSAPDDSTDAEVLKLLRSISFATR